LRTAKTMNATKTEVIAGAGDGDIGGGGAKDKQDATTNEMKKKKIRTGQFRMEVRHDMKKDRDEGDNFVFSLDIAATYPALCQLQSWDPTSTYLTAIVAKVRRAGFDDKRPLTREGFAAMMRIAKLTVPQRDNIANRIRVVLTSTVNGIIRRVDQRSTTE
jgi:hypothetical protein